MTTFSTILFNSSGKLSSTLGEDVLSLEYDFPSVGDAVLIVKLGLAKGVERDRARSVLRAAKNLKFSLCVSSCSVPKPGYTLKMPILEGQFKLKGFKVDYQTYTLRFKRRIRERGP